MKKNKTKQETEVMIPVFCRMDLPDGTSISLNFHGIGVGQADAIEGVLGGISARVHELLDYYKI